MSTHIQIQLWGIIALTLVELSQKQNFQFCILLISIAWYNLINLIIVGLFVLYLCAIATCKTRICLVCHLVWRLLGSYHGLIKYFFIISHLDSCSIGLCTTHINSTYAYHTHTTRTQTNLHLHSDKVTSFLRSLGSSMAPLFIFLGSACRQYSESRAGACWPSRKHPRARGPLGFGFFVGPLVVKAQLC